MKVRKIFILSSILILSIIAIICDNTVNAQTANANSATNSSKSVEVNIEANFEPSSIIGLLINSKQTLQKLKVDFRKVDNYYVVSIPYQENEIDSETVASAVAFSVGGELAFANVKPVVFPTLRKSFLSLKPCAPKAQTAAELSRIQANRGVFESILEVRANRREVAKLQLANSMNADFLSKLQRLERGFGLERSTPLTSDLPALELVDRLSRLLVAINNLSDK